MNQLSNIPYAGDTVTLYHQYEALDQYNKVSVKTKRTVLKNCFTMAGGNVVSSGSVILGNVKHTVKIPLYDNYVDTYTFNAATDKSDIFTVAISDVIILMEANDEIADGSTATKLSSKYGDRYMKITEVSDFTQADRPLKHIKCIET